MTVDRMDNVITPILCQCSEPMIESDVLADIIMISKWGLVIVAGHSVSVYNRGPRGIEV